MVKLYEKDLNIELEKLKEKHLSSPALFQRNVLIIATVSIVVFTLYCVFFNNFNADASFNEKMLTDFIGSFYLFAIIGVMYCFYYICRIVIYVVLSRKVINIYAKKMVEELKKK